MFAYTDPLAWGVVASFVVAALGERRYPTQARYLAAAAWAAFGLFWLLLVPHFFFEANSVLEAALAVAAVPACLYAGYLLASGRTSLFVLTRAVAVMGLVYLPVETIPVVRGLLVEHVTRQTALAMTVLGYDPTVIESTRAGYEGFRATFFFETADPGHGGITYNIVMACTALGSMAIFAGVIAAVRAPIRRKLAALAVAISSIYLLNIARTTFIGLAFGHQWFDGLYASQLMALFGESDPYMVSHIVAEGIVSQSLSLLALGVIGAAVVRILPELLVVVDEVAYVLTGRSRDAAATGVGDEESASVSATTGD